MADRKTFTTPLSTADKFYIWHDIQKNYSDYDADKVSALLADLSTGTWDEAGQNTITYTATDGTTQEVKTIFSINSAYEYGFNLDLDIGSSASGDDYSILATSDTADSITLTTGTGSSQIFTDSTKFDDLLDVLKTSVDTEISTYTDSIITASEFLANIATSTYDSAFIDAYDSYTEPVTPTQEKFVKASTLQTILENYDEKKGTAVVDVEEELPTTIENRTYRLNKDDTDPLETRIWIKGTEAATKASLDNLTDHYIRHVSALPSPIDTDVIYGIDHTYEQSISAKYLVQDFISTFMTKQSTNSWLLNDHVTSTYATITYEDTDYEFNKLYWTGKRYVPYVYDSSTGTSTRVGSFGINIGNTYNYALTWNYEHKDYYVSESSSGKTVQLANVDQIEDWYLAKAELGKANGVAVLDGDGKIPKNELNFTALNYLGMTHVWPEDEDPEAGDFYIVDEEFTHTEGETTTTLEPGDWIIYFTEWQVESNNVIVSSVNGKIGVVVLTGDDIDVTYEGETDTINNTLPKLGKVNTVNGVEPDSNKNVEIDGDDINVTYESTTDTLNNTLPKLGKVKTVNNVEPDDDGNIAIDVGVKTVNSTSPDDDGNVNVGTVKTVNNVSPDSSGNVTLTVGNITGTYTNSILYLTVPTS